MNKLRIWTLFFEPHKRYRTTPDELFSSTHTNGTKSCRMNCTIWKNRACETALIRCFTDSLLCRRFHRHQYPPLAVFSLISPTRIAIFSFVCGAVTPQAIFKNAEFPQPPPKKPTKNWLRQRVHHRCQSKYFTRGKDIWADQILLVHFHSGLSNRQQRYKNHNKFVTE